MINDRLLNPIAILLFESSAAAGDLLDRMLMEAGDDCYEVHRESKLPDAVEYLILNQVDIVLATFSPTDTAYANTIHCLKHANLGTPVVIMVDDEDENAAIAALQAGAQEVLVKGLFPAKALKRVIHYAIERVRFAREKEILEEKLRKAQRMEAIGTIAGGIAHEFNNILSAIIGYTELALEGSESQQDIRDDLKEIAAAGSRAKILIAQMLSLSRQAKTGFGSVHIHLLIKEALKMLREEAPPDIDIQSEIRSFGMVKGDPGQIYQIAKNLFNNAVHAMRGGGVLKVRLQEVIVDEANTNEHPDLDHGSYMSLMVTDNGCGLDPGTAERIFQPDLNASRNVNAEGLGLNMVYGYVKAHGGTITADAQHGKGTRFTVLLPMVKEDGTPKSHGQNNSLNTKQFSVSRQHDEFPVTKTA